MQKQWFIGFATLTVLLIALIFTWLHSSALKVERTIIAELPRGINRLVKTDLDGDGEIELVATYFSPCIINPVWSIDEDDDIDDPRIWLIQSPLINPKAIQLPYVCRLDFPTDLTPLKAILVEDGKWQDFVRFRSWLLKRLGWLRIREGQILFEPICNTMQSKQEQVFEQYLFSSGKSTFLLVFHHLCHSLVFSRPKLVQHFAFQLQPEGTWKPIDLKKFHFPILTASQDSIGDFDGDGLMDELRLHHKRTQPTSKVKLEILWGNGSPTTILLISQFKPMPAKFWSVDVNNDGRWEIVTFGRDPSSPSQWNLTVWQFQTEGKSFKPIARLKGKVPSKHIRTFPSLTSIIGITRSPRPLTYVDLRLNANDLDCDGRKDFMLLWTRNSIPFWGASIVFGKIFAIQVVSWDSKGMKTFSFVPREVPLPINSTTKLWVLEKQRLVVANDFQKRRRLTFRLISLRPLQVQFGETESKPQCTILQLPEGEVALDLRRWRKLSELSGILDLWGDWDRDGKVELLLKQYHPKLPITLYLACVDGHKVHWTKLSPPMPANFTFALPVQTRDDAALFVLWGTKDKTIVERIRW